MKLRKLALACAAIPAALFLTGCGSDDSTTSNNSVQLYVNNTTSGATTLPLDLYDINGSTFTLTANTVDLFTANLPVVTNVVSTAGTDLGNSLVTFSSSPDTTPQIGIRMIAYPVNADGTVGAGVTATRTNALGGAAIYSTEFATAGAAINADDETVPYVVLTSGFTSFEDGDVALAIPGGTQAAPTFAALSIQGEASSGAGFGQVALQQNTAVEQPTAYMTSILPTGSATQVTSAITRCQFTLDASNNPSVVGDCLNKTLVNGDLGSQTITLNLDGSISGTLISDVVGTANGQNMLAVAQVLDEDEITSSAIVNCPVSNWAVNDQCTLLSIPFPAGTPGEQFIQVQTNVNRTQIVINVANNDGDEAAMVCSISADGMEISGCVLPKDTSDNNIEIDLELDKYSAI